MFRYCSCGGFAQGASNLPDKCPFCGTPMKEFGSLAEVEEVNRVDNRAFWDDGKPAVSIKDLQPPDWPDYVDKNEVMK